MLVCSGAEKRNRVDFDRLELDVRDSQWLWRELPVEDMAFSSFQDVMAHELEVIARRRQRVGIPIESEGETHIGQHRAIRTLTDVGAPLPLCISQCTIFGGPFLCMICSCRLCVSLRKFVLAQALVVLRSRGSTLKTGARRT